MASKTFTLPSGAVGFTDLNLPPPAWVGSFYFRFTLNESDSGVFFGTAKTIREFRVTTPPLGDSLNDSYQGVSFIYNSTFTDAQKANKEVLAGNFRLTLDINGSVYHMYLKQHVVLDHRSGRHFVNVTDYNPRNGMEPTLFFRLPATSGFEAVANALIANDAYKTAGIKLTVESWDTDMYIGDIGSSTKAYLGDTQIDAMYLGDNKIF